MKNKLILILIIASFVFAMLPCGLCFAEEPAVTREYISRKIGGVKNDEEKVNVNYTDLRVGQEDCVRVLFFDGKNSLIDVYEMQLLFEGLTENEISLNPKDLERTRYIQIEIISQENNIDGIKLPFEIQETEE